MAGRSQIVSHTGLRGAAALSVVMYHLGHGTSYLLPIEGAVDIFRRSYLFVDLFFILSGFVLSHVYIGAGGGAFTAAGTRNFFVARFARVYPLHLATLLALLLFYAAVSAAAATGFIANAPPMPGTFAQFIGNLFLVQAWGVFAHEGWNVPAWSISTEFAAYLVFPLIALALALAWRTALAGLALLSAGFYAFIGATSGNLDIIVGIAALRCFAGFFLGVALFHLRGVVGGVSDGALSAMQIASVFLMVGLFEFTRNDVLMIIPFALLVLLTCEDRGGVARALSHPVMTRLGDWSYAIYMIHVPIIHMAGFFYWRTLGRPGALPDPAARIVWIVLIYALTIILARRIYAAFEMPVRKALVRRLSARAAISRTPAPPPAAEAG